MANIFQLRDNQTGITQGFYTGDSYDIAKYLQAKYFPSCLEGYYSLIRVDPEYISAEAAEEYANLKRQKDECEEKLRLLSGKINDFPKQSAPALPEMT